MGCIPKIVCRKYRKKERMFMKKYIFHSRKIGRFKKWFQDTSFHVGLISCSHDPWLEYYSWLCILRRLSIRIQTTKVMVSITNELLVRGMRNINRIEIPQSKRVRSIDKFKIRFHFFRIYENDISSYKSAAS